jgi:hypothetical protein
MPVQRGRDAQGPYWRWGVQGHKYRYRSGDPRSREAARASAAKQGRAIAWREHQ